MKSTGDTNRPNNTHLTQVSRSANGVDASRPSRLKKIATTLKRNIPKLWRELWGMVVSLSLLAFVVYYYSARNLLLHISKEASGFATTVYSITSPQSNDDLTKGAQLADAFIAKVNDISTHSYLHELWVHISIALGVAVILIVVVEFRVRRLNEEELKNFGERVANNVWHAVSGRLIPDAITKQIDDILHSDFVHEDMVYNCYLEPIPDSKGKIKGDTKALSANYVYKCDRTR
jgi:hypothetical protein